MEGKRMKVLVVHGAGMDMRGLVDVERFGPLTLPEYEEKIRGYADSLGIDVEFFHSNCEGNVIDKIYAAHKAGDVDAMVINPAGYTAGNYRALINAVRAVRFPSIEVHVSNPTAAGVHSDFSPVCKGVILGCGVYGYYMALSSLKEMLASKKINC